MHVMWDKLWFICSSDSIWNNVDCFSGGIWHLVNVTFHICYFPCSPNPLKIWGPGGGSSSIFEHACHFSKAHQHQKYGPFVRQTWAKVSKKCMKMHDLSFFFFYIWSWQYMPFLVVKPWFSAENDPFVRHFLGQKGTPLQSKISKVDPFPKIFPNSPFQMAHP